MSSHLDIDDGLPLYELLRLLPDLRALSPLREALLAASSSDAATRWDRGSGYATLDARVLSPSRIARAVRAIAAEEAEAVKEVLSNVGRALAARAEGRVGDGVRVLMDTAATLAGRNRHYEAAALLEVAHREATPLGDATLEADLTLRLGEASYGIGRLDRAADLMRRAVELFSQMGERDSEVVALRGLGSVRAAQGRWREAEEHQKAALARCAERADVTRGRVFNNLSEVARSRGELDQAWEWHRQAEAIWSTVDSRADRLMAHRNAALLHLYAGAVEDARRSLLEGLTIASRESERALLLTDLARVALRTRRDEEAEHLAREAEEFAILAFAPDLLIEVYTVLGCAFRNRGDAQCVAFFEKALELARDGSFPLPRAKVHLEYGRYRSLVGDEEEARAHLQCALTIYDETGGSRPAEDAL